MGVYVFRSIHAPWIKVGHHKPSKSRPNVYFRIAGRGFHSCVHPKELKTRLDMMDFGLIAWYPGLSLRDESAIHRVCDTACGEFHHLSDVEKVIAECNRRGESGIVLEDDRLFAVAWALKRSRRK